VLKKKRGGDDDQRGTRQWIFATEDAAAIVKE